MANEAGVIDNYKGFDSFSCVLHDNYLLQCDHFQMAPAASFTGGFRFESGYLAKGLFFNPIQTGRAAFTDEFITLEWGRLVGINVAAVSISLITLIQ